MELVAHRKKFSKFAIVGTTGAVITFGLTFVLTEMLGLWYMLSLVIATGVAMVSNYTLNNYWTFAPTIDPNSASYDWESFYNGNPLQKWWKQKIAGTVHSWVELEETPNEILDYGCGSSPLSSCYENVVAVDQNTAKLNYLKNKNPRITTSCEIPDRQFNTILCIEVVEHLYEPRKLIKDFSDHLYKGGRLIVATPDYGRPLWWVIEAGTPYKNDHINRFTRTAVERMCKESGFLPTKYAYVAGCDLIEEFVKI